MLLLAACMAMAQPDSRGHEQHETEGPLGRNTVVIGCLNKDETSNYVLTNNKTGVKTTVTGPSALEKQAGNHKVKLTGTIIYDTTGHDILEVSGIEHISDTCAAPK